jgi:hypothetical protein
MIEHKEYFFGRKVVLCRCTQEAIIESSGYKGEESLVSGPCKQIRCVLHMEFLVAC